MEDICSKCAHQKVCIFETTYHGVVKAVEDAFSVCDDPLGSASPFTIKGVDCRHYLEKEEMPKDKEFAIGSSDVFECRDLLDIK